MPVILTSVLLIVALLIYRIKRASKSNRISSENFWKRESAAGKALPSSLNDISFTNIPFDSLPQPCPTDSPELRDVYRELKKLHNRPVADLSGYSNTDLKLKYGSENFDELADADACFTAFTRLSAKWGKLLLADKRPEDAEKVLSYAVHECNIRTSACLTALAECCIALKQPKSIEHLIDLAEESAAPRNAVGSLRKILNDFYTEEARIPE